VTKEKPVVVYQFDGTGGKCPSVVFKMEHDKLAANNEIVRGPVKVLSCDRDGKITIRPDDEEYAAKIKTMDEYIEKDRRFGSHFVKIPQNISSGETPGGARKASPASPAISKVASATVTKDKSMKVGAGG
jgi:hypothetical protein